MPVQSSSTASSTASRLEEFEVHLKTEWYSAQIQRRYFWIAQRFIDYLGRKCIAAEAAHAPEAEDFLRWELRSWRRQHGQNPRNTVEWRGRYKTAINVFLRFVHGHWPVVAAPATAIEAFHRHLVQGYDAWMRELRGLATVTRSTRTKQALEFLAVLGPRADQESLAQLGVRDIDEYLQQRCKSVRRQTIEGYTVCLRSFLRYLHGSGRPIVDLSGTVLGPRIYDDEQIPSALRPEEIQAVLEVTRQDSSLIGRRDYAFLMLLAAYGVRAGEIVALRLEDIDWKADILRIRHSKTGAYSELPLLREPGEAVLSYLEKARPESKQRELFLQVRAPYQDAECAGINRRGVVNERVIQERRSEPSVTDDQETSIFEHRSAEALAVCWNLSRRYSR